MTTQEELEAYIKRLLITNNRDINIHEYPELISAGEGLGYDVSGLANITRRVYEKTDWRPYDLIDVDVINNTSFAQGRFFNEDARPIVEKVKNDLSSSEAIAYIISIIRREPYNFKPRLHPAPDTGSFRDPWMSDDAWHYYRQQNEPVDWCGEKAITLEQLGEITFNKKEDAMELLQHRSYLVSAVMMLTRSAPRTQSFDKIFDEVKDAEMRYLTVAHRLNNDLPFRFRGRMYKTLAELMTDACETHEAISQLELIYSKGYINIWQREAKTAAAAWLTDKLGKNGFLELLYKVNPQYPFYVNGQKYTSPVHLVDTVKKSGAVWKDVFQAIDSKELHVWFAAQGKQEWNDHIDKTNASILNSGFYSEDERKLASVQAFIDLVDESAVPPAIQAEPVAISLLNTEASKPLTIPVRLRLSTDGFVKASLSLEPELAGVSLDRTTVKFYSLVENRQCDVILHIDPMKLQKDKLYNSRIVISSVYERVHVPIELSVVFPKKAYILELLKGAGIGAGFFLLLGLLGYAFDNRDYYDVVLEEYLSLEVPFGYLPATSWGYLLLLILLTGGLYFSFRYIRRTYKTDIND